MFVQYLNKQYSVLVIPIGNKQCRSTLAQILRVIRKSKLNDDAWIQWRG